MASAYHFSSTWYSHWLSSIFDFHKAPYAQQIPTHLQMFSSSPFSKIPPRPLVWSGCSLSLISQAQFLLVLLSPVPTSSKNQLIPFCSGVHPESKNSMDWAWKGACIGLLKALRTSKAFALYVVSYGIPQRGQIIKSQRLSTCLRRAGVIKGDRQLFTLYRNIQQVSELDYTLDYAESIDILQGF